MFTIIKNVFGLRVSEEVEIAGIDEYYHGISSYPEFTVECDDTPAAAPGAGALGLGTAAGD